MTRKVWDFNTTSSGTALVFGCRGSSTNVDPGIVLDNVQVVELGRYHRWDASALDQRWGEQVVGIDDLDSDGYGDLAVSAPFADRNSKIDSGVVSFYSGRDHNLLFSVEGEAGQNMGASLASGDFDGDGTSDVLIGLPGGPVPSVQYLSGKTRKLVTVHSQYRQNFVVGELVAAGRLDSDAYPDVLALFNKDRIVAASMLGGTRTILWSVNLFAGSEVKSMANVGDLNADGSDDFVLGLPDANNKAGRVEVRSGRDGSLLRTIPGAAGEEYGYAVSGIGDVNGDGTPDFAASAPGFGANNGSVGFVSGKTFGVLTFRRGTGGARFGTALAPAGDQNGDGSPDVLVAEPGIVRVLSGRDATVVLRELTGGASFGHSLASARTSGTATRDILIGEPTATGGSIHLYDHLPAANPPAFTYYGNTCSGSGGRQPRLHGSSGEAATPNFLDRALARSGGKTNIFLSSAAANSVALCRLGLVRNDLKLDFIGMPGCAHLMHEIITWGVPTDANGAARFGPLTHESDPQFVGVELLWQWLVLDRGANSFGLTMSDAAVMRIGSKL